MVTAYLLNQKHHITVFEKQPILGGNIRTINKNVDGVAIDKNIQVDNGVIEFEENNFVYFHRLMKELEAPLAPVPGTTGLFLTNGQFHLSPYAIKRAFPKPLHRWAKYVESIPLAWRWWRLHKKTGAFLERELSQYAMGDLLADSSADKWIRMLIMYSFSIPYGKIDQVPAVLGVPILRNYWRTAKWNRIEGGVYTYIEKILDQFTGRIVLNADIATIRRTSSGVNIHLQDGISQTFDKVVFATPPDQVLKLLADPSDAEQRRFGNWKPTIAYTLIHTDLSMYRPYSNLYYSEFDLFEKKGGEEAGYNAYLNRLSGLPDDSPVAYNLAFNMEDQIAVDQILHRQKHHTPFVHPASYAVSAGSDCC